MIRNILLLFLASTLFFSPNINAFDQDLLNKTEELLRCKQLTIELKEQLDPAKHAKEKYPQKKIINGQQYLEAKSEKLLMLRDNSQQMLTCGVVGTGASLCAFLFSLFYGNLGSMSSLTSGAFAILCAGIVCDNYSYMKRNNPVATDQQKKEALLKRLERKINKEQIKNIYYLGLTLNDDHKKLGLIATTLSIFRTKTMQNKFIAK